MQNKTLTKRRRSRAVGALLAGALLTAGTVGVSASPAAAATPPDAPWSAAGGSSILDLTVFEPDDNSLLAPVLDILGGIIGRGVDGFSAVDLQLVPSAAMVDSEGIGGSANRSLAAAANVGQVALLGGQSIDVLGISQTAPADNEQPETGTFPKIELAGLADISLLPGVAHARWAGDDACMAADTPVARSGAGIVGANLLPALGLLSIEEQDRGAIDVSSTVSLPQNPGGPGRDPRAVQTVTDVQVASLSLLNDVLKVQVGAAPTLTARATGLPGGASLDYADPLLSVTLAGNPVAVDGSNVLGPLMGVLDPLLDALNIVLGLLGQTIGDTHLRLSTGLDTSSVVESADGTHAAGAASLLHVDLMLAGIQIIDLAILPLYAEATAPEGGLDCGGNNPFDLSKQASVDNVKPGETFDYVLSVGNDSNPACTLTGVTATDVITGPAGAEIVATEPAATSIDGMTATWSNLGPIEPGEVLLLKVTVKTPATATPGQTFSDTLTANGLCDGEPVGPESFTLDGIPRVVEGTLSRTGTNQSLLLVGAAAMLVAAMGLRRVRRTVR